MEIYREVSFLSKKENQIDSFKKLSRIMKKIRDDNLQKYYYDLKEKI
ncbi:hypothetical protein HOG21_00970 [bacterium]|jgi:hypothetical protein|nr:hypothetical protein [bacterium]